jgi:hypothetical protein
MTQHRDIDNFASESGSSSGGLSAHSLEYLKSFKNSERMKAADAGDKIAQYGDQLTFASQTFSPNYGGVNFLNSPVSNEINKSDFLSQNTKIKTSSMARLDGKPYC